MGKLMSYIRSHPVVAIAAVVVIAAVVFLLIPRSPAPVATTSPPGSPAAAPAPAAPPAAAPVPNPPPAPGTAPAPAPAASPAPKTAAGAVDAGRLDPFAPLVRSGAPGGERGGLPPLPPAPLPPPLFPGQAPPQPGAPPAVPPKEAGGAALVGILGDGGAVAIIRIGKDTFIVTRGDMIRERIKVEVIDVEKRLVILEQEGERFELKMGGVSGPHVAASASSSFN